MKKIFTLAIAATAAFSAVAGDGTEYAGTYMNALVQRVQKDSEVLGQFLERSNDIEIVADEQPNHYIIKGFLEDFFSDPAKPTPVNDIKATYNPFTQIFQIDAKQLLTTKTDADGKEFPVYIVTGDAEGNFTYEPIEFEMAQGMIQGPKKPMAFGEIVEVDGKPGLHSAGWAVDQFRAFQPNGEMTYFDVKANKAASCKIYGLNTQGRNLIYNFADVDLLAPAAFWRRGMRVEIDDEFYTARVLIDAPTLDPSWNINELYYLTAIDEEGQPMGSEDGSKQFYLRGTIVKDDPTECVLELPACGLFNKKDQPYNTYKDVVITYDPSAALVGIETVEATAAADAAPVYYNLQGVRVENPRGGIFICRKGNTATKVLVK